VVTGRRRDCCSPACLTVTRSLPHGHAAAVAAMAAKLGLRALLGPAGPQEDLAQAR